MLRFRFVDEHLDGAVEVGADQHIAARLFALLGHRIEHRGRVLEIVQRTEQIVVNLWGGECLRKCVSTYAGARDVVVVRIGFDDGLRIRCENRTSNGRIVRLDALPEVAPVAPHLHRIKSDGEIMVLYGGHYSNYI